MASPMGSGKSTFRIDPEGFDKGERYVQALEPCETYQR